MKRNTIEVIIAIFGLGMVVYGAGLKTSLGNAIEAIGFVVGLIGITPWKSYARNYSCNVCGNMFGGGREGAVSKREHLRNSHGDFYKWDVRWGYLTTGVVLFAFVYIIGIGTLVSSVPSFSSFTNWWLIGFLAVLAVFFLDLADFFVVTKKFRNKWLLLHPGEDYGELRVDQEKLSAGVSSWREFTHGQEEYFGGLTSGGLKKKGNFAAGYGVYFTSTRIFGIKTSRWFVVVLVIAALAAIGGATVFSILTGFSPAFSYFVALPIILAIIALGQNRLRFNDPMSIVELEHRKDLEIRREDISEIDLKKPSAFRRGHLAITVKDGKTFTILINQETGVFDRLKGLVSGFSFVPPASWAREKRATINLPSPEYPSDEGTDAGRDMPSSSPGVQDEKHVGKRDFEWCPHCATMLARGTSICPSCGKSISG
jgi:hypothetical protein